MDTPILFDHVSKSFGRIRAIDDVYLEVGEG